MKFTPKGFHPNITTFRDIYSNLNNKWYKDAWKEFEKLKNIDKNITVQIFMM